MSAWREELERALRRDPGAIRWAARRVLRDRSRILSRLALLSPGQVERVARDVRLGLAFLQDAVRGRLPEVPWRTVAAVAFALGYLAAPLDAVPDFLPAIGLTDDVALLGYVWSAFRSDLERYRCWRESAEAGAAGSAGHGRPASPDTGNPTG